MTTVCPGQDTRYWRPGDIFEITCASCGSAVEFFKDDVRRRCHGCGALVQNPKITLGCAQWCEHAKACLGYDPKEALAEADEATTSLLDQLLQAAREALEGDQDRLDSALSVTEEAEALLRSEAADHRVVLASALLGEVEGERRRALLEGLDFEKGIVKEVEGVIRGDEGADERSRRLLSDARSLVDLRGALRSGAEQEALTLLKARLQTEAGRARGEQLLGEAR